LWLWGLFGVGFYLLVETESSYEPQPGLKRDPPASASQVLGQQACTTTPGLICGFGSKATALFESESDIFSVFNFSITLSTQGHLLLLPERETCYTWGF
jgi:hypothetical protein